MKEYTLRYIIKKSKYFVIKNQDRNNATNLFYKHIRLIFKKSCVSGYALIDGLSVRFSILAILIFIHFKISCVTEILDWLKKIRMLLTVPWQTDSLSWFSILAIIIFLQFKLDDSPVFPEPQRTERLLTELAFFCQAPSKTKKAKLSKELHSVISFENKEMVIEGVTRLTSPWVWH